MNISDKIICLRKRQGWSQEELAYKLDVSRQAVSKWESGSSLPDVDKLVKMSQLFGVSTDVLLKDGDDECFEADEAVRAYSVSDEQANSFLACVEKHSFRFAVATFLCILSPICLLILGALSDVETSGITESLVVGVGMGALLLFVIVALSIFIPGGYEMSKFNSISRQKIIITKEMRQSLMKTKEDGEKRYVTSITIAVILCVLAVLPLFIAAAFTSDDNTAAGLIYVICVCALLVIAGIGVMIFCRVGMVRSSIDCLLQTGDYSIEHKSKGKAMNTFDGAYWPIAVAIYLLWSFLSQNWHITWVVWPIAGVLYGAIKAIIAAVSANKKG